MRREILDYGTDPLDGKKCEKLAVYKFLTTVTGTGTLEWEVKERKYQFGRWGNNYYYVTVEEDDESATGNHADSEYLHQYLKCDPAVL